VWKGHLTFGLVSLPVKLHSAARRESVGFHMLHAADQSRVKQVLHCAHEDKAVPRAEIVNGYEYEKDKYIVISQDEIDGVAPKTTKAVDISEFVKAADINPVFLESSYYVAPGAAASENAYALLYKALKETGYVGVGKIGLHNREHIVIVRAGEHGIVMHTTFFNDEIRQVEEFRTDTTAVKDQELAMAIRLMQELAGPFQPEKYTDKFREGLQQMIQAKIGSTPQNAARAQVIDITTALEQSLSAKGSHAAKTVSHIRVSPRHNPLRNSRNKTRGIRRRGARNSAPGGQHSTIGDPILANGGPGSNPQAIAASSVGTPKRELSSRKNRA